MLHIVAGYNCAHIWAPPYFFFSKIGLRLSIDIILSYHRVQFQKKTNDPILSKLSEGRKDGRE